MTRGKMADFVRLDEDAHFVEDVIPLSIPSRGAKCTAFLENADYVMAGGYKTAHQAALDAIASVNDTLLVPSPHLKGFSKHTSFADATDCSKHEKQADCTGASDCKWDDSATPKCSKKEAPAAPTTEAAAKESGK
eukprot:TRINITY_DN90855_c0_g1_i1.p1 TRINITY_DN90855_c0_g1~~TRINITY_DN90855_c0_g1_i1.p1  ORF type:complete len:135 (+),score=28.10 TRINITY_DN90855_c0_g1_i1:72-476(+)